MRVVTVFGPSQSGKTSLAGAIAGLEGRSGKSLDIPGVAGAHRFHFMDEDWTAIDLDGGTDSLAQVATALAASDAGILCVPADADAAVLAAPFLRLVEASGVPTLLFINGIDRAQHRVAEVVAALQTYCSHSIVLRQVPMRDGDEVVGAVDLISERAWKYNEGRPSTLITLPDGMIDREKEARGDLLESLADFDDHLLEQVIEDQEPLASEVYDIASRTLEHGDLIPTFIGSATHVFGVFRLMKALRHETPTVETAAHRLPGALAAGLVADHVKHLGKTVLIRALGPGVSGGAALGGASLGSITDIDAKTPMGDLAPGDIALTVKSDHISLGRAYGPDGALPLPDWTAPSRPNFRSLIVPAHDRDEARLSEALDRLSEIDPGFTTSQDGPTGHTILAAQGPQHLRRLVAKLKDGFGVEVDQEPVHVALCETIEGATENHHRHRKQSGGAGQFADVVVEVRPETRGQGFVFEEVVKGGAVPRNYIPSVEAGAREALDQGPNGHPVIDVHVTLKDGKSHSVDSSDFAFKTAGKNAVKEALEQIGTVVLQPIAKVTVDVPSVFTGGLVATVSGLKGQVLGFDSHPVAAGWDVFDCMLPETALDDFFNALASATRGTATFTCTFDHHEKVRPGAAAALADA